ncbi:hypothetical protein [Vibrio mangrovi]|uniref:Uncharacterized protein n=1 Tax=Vibrio mangrovi TaxID=474394 RepID=A0A1Y6IWZ7_9VIBR|nr:hypothetical protein [Vibrio mangrovi]MDW6004721.1 hypothetical protein [Vibrio mangrovi]SMS01012.1 hypothetical protein VIM7927_02289 [Vibrio mangrovi]
MEAVFIEKKSGTLFHASSGTEQELDMFRSSFLSDDFRQTYGEPDVDFTDTYRVKRMNALRKSAYQAESDPLYMEWQYDQTETKAQIWRDKVTEIKTRYPLPESK